MALTRTRTRTQTALTRLATMVAEVHGELEFVEGLLTKAEAGRAALSEEQVKALQAKKTVLEEKRQALCLTLEQFDARIVTSEIDAIRPYAATFQIGKFLGNA